MRKRHKAWSNCYYVGKVDKGAKGKLHRKDQQEVQEWWLLWKQVSQKYSVMNLAFIPFSLTERMKINDTMNHGIIDFHVVQIPRSYPIPFGLRVLRLMRQTVGQHAGCPDDTCEDATALFHKTAWNDLWPEAKVLDACVYMRGCIHLEASDRWKAVFPSGLPLV